MDAKQIDWLLEEGLKQYSRVEVPAGFSARLEQKLQAKEYRAGARRYTRWWMWLAVPAAVAAAAVLMLVRPPDVAPPQRIVAAMPEPSWERDLGRPSGRRDASRASRMAAIPRRSFHELSPEEIAALQLPPQILSEPKAEELSVPDLAIPDVKIPAIETEPNEEKRSK